MATTGYSGTPLIKEPGINGNMKVQLINEPGNYFGLLQTDIRRQLAGVKEIPDLVHLFVTSVKEFETAMHRLKPVCKRNPSITIRVSWYKKSAKMPTDITEDVIRYYALKNDLAGVKVCAVSDIWSGLKLVAPLAKR